MEEEKIIQGPQKLHTENPEEIEDMLSKKVDGVFADGANLDTLTLKNSSEIELKIVKLKEEIDQKIQEINSFDTQHSNLSKGEIEIKQNTLVDDLVTLANRQQVGIARQQVAVQQVQPAQQIGGRGGSIVIQNN